MENKKKRVGAAFFEGSSWYHRYKVRMPDGTVTYSKKGGFETAAAANASYKECDKNFKEASRTYELANKKSQDIMLKDYLIYWLDGILALRATSNGLAIAAYAIYDLIMPVLDYDIKLKYVNSDYLNTLLERASKKCASAGNKAREILNIALNDAVVHGYLKINPVPSTKSYKRQKPKIIILKKDDIKVLLEASEDSNWYLEILLALFCGLRKGEILGLKFQDYDKEEKILHIRRQLGCEGKLEKGSSKYKEYKLTDKATKTENSIRALRVPDIIAVELEKRRKKVWNDKERYYRIYEDHDYVSCQENGKPHSLASLNIALTKICDRSGLPHITVHGLRHMYATVLLEMGVPLVKISALLGHASVHTTFEYYCDVMEEEGNVLAFMNEVFIPVETEVVS